MGCIQDVSVYIIELIPLVDHMSAIALSCTARCYAPLFDLFKQVNRVIDVSRYKYAGGYPRDCPLHGAYTTDESYTCIMDLIGGPGPVAQLLVSPSGMIFQVKYIWGVLHSISYTYRSQHYYLLILKTGCDYLYVEFMWADVNVYERCIYITERASAPERYNNVILYYEYLQLFAKKSCRPYLIPETYCRIEDTGFLCDYSAEIMSGLQHVARL